MQYVLRGVFAGVGPVDPAPVLLATEADLCRLAAVGTAVRALDCCCCCGGGGGGGVYLGGGTLIFLSWKYLISTPKRTDLQQCTVM